MVVSIIALISTVVLVRYSNQELENPEEQAVLQFVSDLRKVQSMAMNVYNCPEIGIQEEYCLEVLESKKYKITCGSETTTKIDISPIDKICFLPIDIDRPTIEITGDSIQIFNIGSTTINISDNGQIGF